MRSNDLFLFATNTGALYAEHKRLARAGASVTEWRQFLKSVTLPMYRQQTREPYEGLSLAELDEAAQRLASYYAAHVLELAQ